jgi:hypothetical protein
MKSMLTAMALAIISLSCFAQKPVKTPSKEVMFKTAAYWKSIQENKLKNAPAAIQQAINQKNALMQNQGRSVRFGYTSQCSACFYNRFLLRPEKRHST